MSITSHLEVLMGCKQVETGGTSYGDKLRSASLYTKINGCSIYKLNLQCIRAMKLMHYCLPVLIVPRASRNS